MFVLDRNGHPLMPCTEKRARLLLARGRARVHRVLPFVIRLVDVRLQDCEVQPLRIKLDPGSQTTGIALVREARMNCSSSISSPLLRENIPVSGSRVAWRTRSRWPSCRLPIVGTKAGEWWGASALRRASGVWTTSMGQKKETGMCRGLAGPGTQEDRWRKSVSGLNECVVWVWALWAQRPCRCHNQASQAWQHLCAI